MRLPYLVFKVPFTVEDAKSGPLRFFPLISIQSSLPECCSYLLQCVWLQICFCFHLRSITNQKTPVWLLSSNNVTIALFFVFLNLPYSFIRSIPYNARDCAARAHEDYLSSTECVSYTSVRFKRRLWKISLKMSRLYFCPFVNQWLLLKLCHEVKIENREHIY